MSVYLADPDVTLLLGDAVECLRTLPDESVHMCVTSPPFYGLRDYQTGRWEGGDPEHEHDTKGARGGKGGSGTLDKRDGNAQVARVAVDVCSCGARRVDQQIGLEETPERWVESLVAVFREVRRVLRADGTLWVEIGDSYVHGQGGRQSGVGELPPTTRFDRKEAGVSRPGLPSSFGARDVGPRFYPGRESGMKPKDLIGAPWLLAFALRADGWWLRSEIIWAKPNPMPESVTDRPTTAHSRIFLFAREPRYYFDAEAVRESAGHNTHSQGKGTSPKDVLEAEETGRHVGWGASTREVLTARNCRSVWEIATQPFPEAHFATFPQALVRRCILAGSSERGCCPVCGAPWVREVEGGESTYVERKALGYDKPANVSAEHGGGHGIIHPPGFTHTLTPKAKMTTGWRPSCACGRPDTVPALILDCFMGSGTTAHVARKLGRRAIGIDLNAAYLEMASRRLAQQSLFSAVVRG